MNRTDRLLAIVLELQGKGEQRAEDLAATFETSKRTIYRDIQALSEAGVPLVAVPGRGYSLVEGYFLPPLSFSVDEATMLLLGSDVMAESFDAQYRDAAQAAYRKIAGVLPEHLRAEVQYLRESIRFVVPKLVHAPEVSATLQTLRRAILDRTTVRFHYHTRSRPEDQAAPPGGTRDADPYGLSHVGNTWYLVAHDHTRHEVRTFRLDRMEGLRVLEKTFARPKGFTLERRNPGGEGQITVRVLFAPEVARWVREAPSFFTVALEDTAEGLLMTLRVRQEREVAGWLLGWGRNVRILEPASLRQRVLEEARAAVAMHEGH
jgi:predicted DNA-binding transcriptional regulator YafY